MDQPRAGIRRVLTIALVAGLLLLGYLVLAWLVVTNTDVCWWPWSDILPGAEKLCSIGM